MMHAYLCASQAVPQAGVTTPSNTIPLTNPVASNDLKVIPSAEFKEGCLFPGEPPGRSTGRLSGVVLSQRAVMLLSLFRGGADVWILEDLRPGRGFAARVFLLPGSWPAASLSSASPAFFCVMEQAQMSGRNILSTTTWWCVRHEPGKQHPGQAVSSSPLLGRGQRRWACCNSQHRGNAEKQN